MSAFNVAGLFGAVSICISFVIPNIFLVIPSVAKESTANEELRYSLLTIRYSLSLDSFTSLRSVQNDGAFKFNFVNTTQIRAVR